MYTPRLRASNTDYSAADARRVLENLRTGAPGQGVLRYRRSGGAFFVTNEREVPEAPNHREEER
jgi:hypothetical protein